MEIFCLALATLVAGAAAQSAATDKKPFLAADSTMQQPQAAAHTFAQEDPIDDPAVLRPESPLASTVGGARTKRQSQRGGEKDTGRGGGGADIYAGQWLIVVLQAGLGLFLVIWSSVLNPRAHEDTSAGILHKVVRGNDEVSKHLEWQKARKDAMENGQSIFCSHVRSEDNFVRGNKDHALRFPPGSPLEVESHYYSRRMLVHYLFAGETLTCFILCLGCALLSGSLASLLALSASEGPEGQWVVKIGGCLKTVVDDLKFFPLFMVVGQVGFFVERWRAFMLAAWGVEGRLKDMCMAIGSDIVQPGDPETRKLLFKIYRYCVLAMTLEYRNIIPQLKAMNSDPTEGYANLGLWTTEEAAVLLPTKTRMRDTVLAWIALEVNSNGPDKTKLLGGKNTLFIMEQIGRCRGEMMYFWGNNFFPRPNTFQAMLRLLVDVYGVLIMFSYPFEMVVPFTIQSSSKFSISGHTCFQPLSVLCVFTMLFCFWGMDSLSRHLARPWESSVDTYNIDALITGTEETLFAYLRASFDHA